MPKDNFEDHIFALIVVGGGGTRLWPKSRNNTPKQFLRLFNNQTLTQITANRFRKILPWERIFAVTTSEEYREEILKEIPEFSSKNIIVEPMRKNTAPAHALGALYIHQRDPKAVILNESADHLVDPIKSYLKSMLIAAEAAFEDDCLIAVGIKPTYPNTGYGYIKRGDKLKNLHGKIIFKLDKFTEKPDLVAAEKYIRSGNYYWNANQYVWRADSFLSATARYAPAIYSGLEKIKNAINTDKEMQVLKEEYEKIPEISVDYAISEKAKNFLLISADYHWTDIGDWKEVWENLPKDSEGNVIIDGPVAGGKVMEIDTSDSLVHTDGRLVAVIGVDNIVVIDTEDALLVASKSRAQYVKKIVEELKKDGKSNLL
jgi:mannose-1-phosphate guanylyltransferase